MSGSLGSIAQQRYERLADLELKQVGARRGLKPRDVVASIRDLLTQREMLDLLIRRDLKAKYKDSTLGFFWSLARPLMQLAIYFVVVGQFLSAARGIPDFAVYIFSGLVAMGLFTEILTGATGSIIMNAALVKKVYLPREVFPLASVGSALFNFGVQLIVLVGATLLVGKPPLHAQILYVIPATLVLVVYGTALGLFFSAVNVYLRDIQYLVEVGTMLLFWASPIVYSWGMVQKILGDTIWLDIYTNNPLTLAVLGFQRAFWVAGEGAPQPTELLLRLVIALVIGVVLLFFSHRAFLQMQGNFAQEI
jgi:ABC-2 type transport system permease protein